MFKFQTCLQNVSKAVWEYCCVEMAASVKSDKKKKKLEINLACRPIETNDGSQFLRKLF